MPTDTTHFISKNPQFSAQTFKAADKSLSPALPVPFKMNRMWPSESAAGFEPLHLEKTTLAFEAALCSVPKR